MNRYISHLLLTLAMIAAPVAASSVYGQQKRPVLKKQSKEVKSSFATPDFAYPQTVANDARNILKDPSSSPADKVKGAIQVTAALNSISVDNVPATAATLDSLAKVLPSPYSQIMYSIEAQLYTDYYRYNGTQRPEARISSGDDSPALWDKNTFTQKVMELVDRSLAGPDLDTPLSSVKCLLGGYSALQEEYYPTVYDLLAYRSLGLLSEFATRQTVIPFSASASQTQPPAQLAYTLSQEIIDGLIRRYSDRPKPLSRAVMAKYADAGRTSAYAAYSYWQQQTAADPGSMVFVYLMGENLPDTPDILKEYHKLASDMVARYPDADYTPAVRNILTAITRSEVRVKSTGLAVAGRPVSVTATTKNTDKYYLLLFKTEKQTGENNYVRLTDLTSGAVEVLEVSHPGTAPFSYTDTLKFGTTAPLAPGYYALVASRTKSISGVIGGRKQSVGLIRVGRASAFAVNGAQDQNGSLYVVYAENGKPVEGASVEYFSQQWNKRNTLLLKNRTDSSGASSRPGEWATAQIRVTDGAATDLFRMDVSGPQHSSSATGKATHATILTDLPIYRPADTLQFAMVAYADSLNVLSVAQGLAVEVMLYDANNQQVGDTLHLETDTDGRARGQLPIKATGPTGTYRISARANGHVLANTFVTVAEYVAPTFYVEADSITMQPGAPGPVTVKGKVMTYSGMPLAGASVNMVINYRQLHWWRSDDDAASYGATTTTDAKGEYSFTLATDSLSGTRFATGVFDVAITATSPAGESQAAAPVSFILGKGYRLVSHIPARLRVDGDKVTFTVDAQNALGESVPMEATYELTNTRTGRTVAKGRFTTPTLTVGATSLPSGQYNFRVVLEADTSTTTSIPTVIYRSDDKQVPCDNATLWVPTTKITAAPGAEKVKVRLGSSYPDSYVLMQTGTSDGRITDTRWLRCGPTIQTVEVPAPRSGQRVWVRFQAMHDFAPATEQVEILPSSSDTQLEIQVVSFRDKLVSGTPERWEFTLLQTGDNPGAVVNAPVMAVMTDQALNALVNFRWMFSPGNGLWWRNPLGGSQYSWINPVSDFAVEQKWLKQFYLETPAINLYGIPLSGRLEYGGYTRPLAAGGPIKVRGTNNMAYSADQVAPTTGAVQEMKMSVTTTEAAVMEDESTSDSGHDNGSPQLREVEHPLAFFMPNLSTDSQGNLKLSFTTPDFNTTWQLQLLAYDRQLHTATEVLTATASKPVMVQSTVPRFLRTSDRPVLTATAFNNTDTTASVSGYMEVFDPATGNLLQRKEFGAEPLEAKAARLFSIDVVTPDTVQIIGLRTVATSGVYSDGEQVLVCVAPSSIPVVEATPFYMAPSDTAYSLKLPEYRHSGTVTLQYTDNPVWYCVTALPQISIPESESLPALLYAGFGNELAAALVERNPAIAQALQIWSQTKSPALVSPLLKDGNLKTMALQQTVWVNNAQSETMRMMALSQLLDPERNTAASGEITRKIAALQASNGGWAWLPGMEPSLYMTTEVLRTFGRLKALGVTLDAPTEEMLEKGIRFADDEIYQVYQESLRHKSGFPTTLMLDYFSFRQEYSVPLSARMRKLQSLTLTHVARDWRSMEISRQARAAVFLHANGRAKEAAAILESLRQRASSSPQNGMWYDNLRGVWNGDGPLLTTAAVLEAFATIRPKAPEVDMLRQWLVLQRQTQDWGDNRMVAEAVFAILTTGTTWTTPAAPASITIAGTVIEPDAVEALTGSFTVTLDATRASGATLSVNHHGTHPAWGGVIQQYIAPITTVTASSVPDLTIDKQIYVVETTPGGERLRLVDDATLVVGQRVRISLTLTAGRDLDYVAVTDSRAACMQPADQLSAYTRQGHTWYYYEPRNQATNLFIGTLTKGSHVLTYDCYVQQAGLFASGIATAQSQYAPLIVAHSKGLELKVLDQ